MRERNDHGDDDRFRLRPGAPKQRGQSFVRQVLQQAGKAGRVPRRKGGKPPGARLGRGHVAARFTGRTLSPDARRATVKTRLVYLRQVGARSTITHLRYIEREGVGRQGEPGQAYGPVNDKADLAAFEQRGREDRHQFRFIVSPEDAAQLDDLRTYTRHLMTRMEADLGTSLDWVAVDHWNTDNPHTHIVLRGKDETGRDLVIAPAYLTQGMRERARELATQWLGPRSELEIQRSLQREVEQARWTSLDRTLQRQAQGGLVHLQQLGSGAQANQQRVLLIGRLQHLQRMGLANEEQPGTWAVRADAEPVLRALGERGDILRTMQRAMGSARRELTIFQSGENAAPVIGRIAAKGLSDELYDRGYLVLDGTDGRAHYIPLPRNTELAQYPAGAVVEVRSAAEVRAADKTIAALATDGVYRTDRHLAAAREQAAAGRDPSDLVDAHVRRLEALRRAGIVERIADGVWRVPADLPERGRQYDARRLGGAAVELRSHLPIERQARVIGATWLDQQLIAGSAAIGEGGFGGEVRIALRQRAEFLVEQGLAERRGQRVILARNLLATLRQRDIETTAKTVATETGLSHRPVADGQRVAGIYRRSVQLASGRYALLQNDREFSLVPWRPVVEKRLGQSVGAVVRGGRVSWELGRRRGLSR